VAPSPQDVIVTIRSRCRQVGLRIPSVEAVTELLIAQDGVDSAHAREAAMAAQCHIGVARRLARDPQARARRERVLSLPLDAASVGQAVIAAGELVDLAQAEAKADGEERDRAERAAVYKAYGIEEGDRKAPAAIRQQIDQFSKRAKDDSKRRATRSQRDQLDRAMVDLLSFYRDVLSVQTRSGVALINTAHAAEISQMANTTATAATLRAIDVVGEARVRLLGNAAPALTVEAMAVGLALAGESGR
jgi:DNA polymerase-3 subunit delta'